MIARPLLMCKGCPFARNLRTDIVLQYQTFFDPVVVGCGPLAGAGGWFRWHMTYCRETKREPRPVSMLCRLERDP